MERLDLSKLKLGSSSLGERIKTGGAQMGRTIGSKIKEILHTPTPESKSVDKATCESMGGPNWGLNLRICSMISRGEYDGAGVVRAIKRKLAPGRNPVSQGLSLDLLEACASNCDKVFSAVAAERVLEDMVTLIEDTRTEHGIRVRAMELIRAWGESEELQYLPIFQQTYMQLKLKEIPEAAQEEDFPPMLYNLESYLGQQHRSPPDQRDPLVPDTNVRNEQDAALSGYDSQSIEEKREFLAVARNSLDVFSTILSSDAEPKPFEDELTLISMLEKCKRSLPAVQRIIENTSDDEVMLFDALNLHDELRRVVSRHGDLVAAIESRQTWN